MLWNKSYNTDAMMAVKIINATGAYEPLSTATTHIMSNAGSTWMKERNTNNTDTINVNLSIDSQNNLSYALDTYFNCVEHENEEWYNSSFGIKLAVPEWEAIVTAFTLSVIIVLTVIGNTLVILSVFIYKPLRIVQNFFIVSLALADLTVALLVLPFNVAYSILGRWEFGILMCKIWLTCDVLCCTSSILNLCAIALDRYWAITDPINYAKKRTVNRVLLLIAGVWILSLLISSPPLLGWNDWSDEFTIKTPCELNSAPGYIIYSSLGSFFIPLIIMTIVYIEIFFATRRRLRERAQCAKLNTLSLKVSIPYVETFPSSNITKNQKSQSISSICYNIICCTSNMSNCFPTSIIMQNDHNSLSSDTNIHNNDNICIPNIEQPVVIIEQRKKTRRPRIKDSIKHGKLRAKKLNNERKEKSNNMAAISGDELLLQSSVTTQEISTESASDSKGGAKEATVIDDEIKDEKITPSPLLQAIPLQKKSIGVYQFIEEKQKISLSKERRAARTLGIIMGVFVICWLPFFLMYVILPFCRTCCPTSKFKNFITWLGYINSVLNPIIYTIFNLDYRRAFKRLLGMK